MTSKGLLWTDVRRHAGPSRVLALAWLLWGAAALATELAVCDFTGNNGTGDVAFDSVADQLSAGNITRGAGVTAVSRTNSLAAEDWTTDDTVSSSDYVEFTLTPASGYMLDLESLVFGEQQTGLGYFLGFIPFEDDPQQWAVRSSLDNYGVDLGQGETASPGSVGTRTVDLSSLPLITSSVTFRIYGYDATVLSLSIQDQAWALVNYESGKGLTVNGSVMPVPEPGALLCLCLGGGLLLALRARRPECALTCAHAA